MKKIDKILTQHFLLILIIYFLIFFTIRVVIGNSFERDEAEQFLLNGIIEFGYSTQPPLYTWIQSIFFKLFNNPFIALALFKNIILFLIYYFVYKTTLILSKNRVLATISTSSLILIPALSWEAQRDLTHTPLVTLFSIILIYFIIKLRDKKAYFFDYILLGVIVAFGILAKYNFLLIIITLFILSFFDNKLKEIILNKKIFISIIVSLIILTPHIFWLINHFEVATKDTISKMKIVSNFNPLISLKVLLLAILELLILYISLFSLFFIKDIDLNRNNFFKKYLLIATLILIFIVIGFKMQYFKSRWIVPLYIPITIFMTLTLKNVDIKKVAKWLYLIIFIMFSFFTVYILRYTNPDIFKHPSRFNYPAKDIYNYIKRNNINTNILLYNSNLVGANFKLYKNDIKTIPLNKKNLKKYKNELIILDKDSFSLIPWLKENGIKLKELNFKYKNSKKIYKIYINKRI